MFKFLLNFFAQRRGRWKKIAPTATKKESFLRLLVQFFFTAPFSKVGSFSLSANCHGSHKDVEGALEYLDFLDENGPLDTNDGNGLISDDDDSQRLFRFQGTVGLILVAWKEWCKCTCWRCGSLRRGTLSKSGESFCVLMLYMYMTLFCFSFAFSFCATVLVSRWFSSSTSRLWPTGVFVTRFNKVSRNTCAISWPNFPMPRSSHLEDPKAQANHCSWFKMIKSGVLKFFPKSTATLQGVLQPTFCLWSQHWKTQ